MSFSDPRTWVTGELVTASLLNVQLRDQLDAVIEGTTGAYVNAVTGPHAIGGSTVDYVRLGLTGAFTSGGASTAAFGMYTSGVLTGHSGDSAAIAGIKANNSIVTAGNCTTIAQLWVSEPQITVGSGAVTNSAAVYIEGAATEATNDYSLFVGAGVSRFAANVGVGTVTVPTSPASIDKILEIESGTSAGLVLHDTTAEAWDIYANGTDLSIGYNNAVNMRIEGDTGYVAIGAPGAAGAFAGALSVNKDLDNVCYFGKSFLSSTGTAMTADRAHWGHVDMETGTAYAIMQHQLGDTNLNAPTGKSIYFNIAAASKMTMNAAGLSIVGSLSKGSGSFNIAHPLMPDTHRLVHSFAESNETLLIHRGTVDLVDGSAEVDLDVACGMTPGTWVRLCRDGQCYTSNESAWAAVRGSVTGSTLTIDCEDADCTDTVAWSVFSNRHDEHMYDTEWTDEDGYPIIEPLAPDERPYD